MASVIRFFKKKIKPFKRCVTNPSQISFERQNDHLNVKRQKSLDENYYKVKCANNDDFNSHATDTFTDNLSIKADVDILSPTSCPSKFTFSETANQNSDLVSTCCTKASSYYNTTNDADDGLKMESTETMTMLNSGQYQQTQHMIHESTPFFNTNKYMNNELNTELKYALQETIPYDDLTVATKLSAIKSNSKTSIKRCGNNGNSSAKTSTLMNGTYTVGNKMKSNSIKSNRKSYKFFSRNKNLSTSKQENENSKSKQPTPKQQQPQPQLIEIIKPEMELPLKPKNDIGNLNDDQIDDNISNASAHSDSLCDPLFSSTLKSSSSAVCDDSSVRLEKKLQENHNFNNQNDLQKVFENGMNTVTISKTAFRKFLIKNQDAVNKSNESNVSNSKELNQLNHLYENILFDNSMEKMRRSISLPGMNDPLSPIVGNLSKISTIKDADEIELSNQLQVNNLATETSSHIPLTTSNSKSINVINSETFDANLYSLNANGENTANSTKTDIKSTEDLLKSRVKDLASAFKEIRNINGRQINRSKSLLENTNVNNFNDFCSLMINRKRETEFETENVIDNAADMDDENSRLSGYQNRFIRGGTHKIRMSKTIKQMFKNVVKYQMNALNCLEKFYEAQVLKLETDRRRDLTLNPECKEYIIKFYDLQLSQLEERVYSNLSYICRNRCNGCNIGAGGNTSHCNSHSNLMLNNSKMSRMAQMIMQQHQHQQLKRRQFSVRDTNELKDNAEEFFSQQPQFKRQFSLPYQCKSSHAYYQLPPHPPNYTTRLQMQQKQDQQQQQLSANRNMKKFTQKPGNILKGKYTKQMNSLSSSGSVILNDLISNGSNNNNNNISIRNTQKKYSHKRLNTNLNYSTSTETLNSISINDQTNNTNISRNNDMQAHVKRQIKSASSLQAVDENEQQLTDSHLYKAYNQIDEANKVNYSGIKRQNKMLTNGSLAIALQNSTNLSKTSSNYLLNSIDNNNEFSSSTVSSSVFLSDKQHQQFEHPLLRLSDSFQNLKYAEQFLEQPITSSPTHTRRHTYGADKYFKFKTNFTNRLESNSDDLSTIDSKRQRQINSLKETQV